ncbi:Zn-dependent dipeptidase, microsomal dipeptidase [Sphaerochaeta pleomorpha str. Grapes]|uniref:Zn-dependent dipeptidase, microsomal dipeptidase n=1 Tax=Sphaerochaeta pleomorpha (strain ATCC BAA-1885 / DSM 22778 / Grapes) TaxID=158190 RepID=G8QUS7_SPHPG|nr:membrane dipeptidase [Sphaerochaeta pleomorpha]AEV30385.1 Zn-dependent dipeptidase, microsomal dipeptidase [Sphaerochaeta pleomorpha str. Grapes]
MKPLIDLHCDTFFAMHENPKQGNLKQNSFSVDIEKMQRGKVGASCFALFVELQEGAEPWNEVCALHDLFVHEMTENADTIRQIKTAKDFSSNDRLGAILSCEEGQVIEGDLSRLAILGQWGVRLFTLTWNFENDLAYPNSSDKKIMGNALKPLGLEAVSELERQHILVDVSHLNDGGFWDVVRYAKKPFLASHSNSRFCTSANRNLTDEMIRALASKGGVAGLNFYPPYLSDDSLHASRIEDMVRHLQHMHNIGGAEVLALGTDFDGIEGDLEIPDISKMEKLWEALKKADFKERELDMLWQTNALRLLGE